VPSAPHPPQPPRSPAEQHRLEAALRELFERRITFNEVLGLRIDSFDPHAPRTRLAMRPELVGPYTYGRLHGGVISSVMDATAGLALMLALADKHRDEPPDQVMQRFTRMGTIDLRVDFLRQGLGREFVSGARVTRLGGRIASVQMTLANEEGTLIATGAAAYVVS
jgi:uncharacterized protein (TIGR00369 family)